MDRYYYIASQLPFLQMSSETEFSQTQLFYELEKWLNESDFQQLEEADINNTDALTSDTSIIKQYKEFEKLLRNELVAWRKAKKDGYEHKTTIIPSNLLKEGNPLEIEKKLLKLRWDFLEEQGLDHYFDLEFLILYNYKLQILGRLKSFDKDLGLKNFKQYTEVGI